MFSRGLNWCNAYHLNPRFLGLGCISDKEGGGIFAPDLDLIHECRWKAVLWCSLDNKISGCFWASGTSFREVKTNLGGPLWKRGYAQVSVLPMAGCKSWRCWSVWRGEWCKKQSYPSCSIKLRRWSLTSGYSACVQRQLWESLVSGQLLCHCTKLVWSGNGCGIPNALPASSCWVCEPMNWTSCCCTTIPREGSRQCFELHSNAVPCSCSVPLIDLKSFPRNLKSTNLLCT